MTILKIIGGLLAIVTLIACAVSLYVLVGFALGIKDDGEDDR